MRSARLEKVGSFVPKGARMADIGCDHAYLPIALIQSGQVSFAIGCDINRGPLEAAQLHVAQSGLDAAQIDLRLGNGLAPLKPNEVDVVTIAGMGARLIVDILDRSPEVVQSLNMLILSPNVAPWLVREWAMANGFSITNETVLEENGHYYEVLALEPTNESVLYNELELYFGTKLLYAKDATTEDYFKQRRDYDAHVMQTWQPLRERRPDVNADYERLERLWKEWEACRS